ncbi:MAG: VOC family protein [Candidatus Sumerlaeota bacterium]
MEPRISIITLGVADLRRSYHFYKDGLGLPTSHGPDDAIIFLKTSGTCLALYPWDKLAEDIGPDYRSKESEKSLFNGITLAHNTRHKHEVDELLQRAAEAGGRMVKPAQDAFWGGYSGYFADPDGYLWEIAWAESWQFNPDGSLVIE